MRRMRGLGVTGMALLGVFATRVGAQEVLGPPIHLPNRTIQVPSGLVQPPPDSGTPVDGARIAHAIVQFAALPTTAERLAFENRLRQIVGDSGISGIPPERIGLRDSVRENSFIVAIPIEILRDQQLGRRLLGEVDDPSRAWAIVPLVEGDRLSPRLPGRVSDHARLDDGRVLVRVQFHSGIPESVQTQILNDVFEDIEAEDLRLRRFPISRSAQVAATENQLLLLALQDGIKWISEIPGPVEDDNDRVRSSSGVNSDGVNLDSAFGLSGDAVVIAQWESGIADSGHPDFQTDSSISRITAGANASVPEVKNHATHVAATAIGSGEASDGQWRGVAFGARVRSYRAHHLDENLETQYVDALGAAAGISNNSWGTSYCHAEDPGDPLPLPCYDMNSQLLDALASGRWSDGSEVALPRILIVGSAGDQGLFPPFWGTTRVPHSAKNTLLVGAYNSDAKDEAPGGPLWVSSGKGPTPDGRLKPDLVGPGAQASLDMGVVSACAQPCDDPQVLNDNEFYFIESGTSMAVPSVSGAAAMLTEWYLDACRPETPKPSTLRALMLHSAIDIVNLPSSYFPGAPQLVGPDFAYGYGRVDLPRAVAVLPHHLEAVIDQGKHEYEFTIGQVEDLKVTLAWDDPPAAFPEPNTTAPIPPLLVNDLDLEVQSPDGVVYTPWMLDPSNPMSAAVMSPGYASSIPSNARDDKNTVEQVLVPNAGPGTWTIRVRASRLTFGPQDYSVVGDFIETSAAASSLPPDSWQVQQCEVAPQEDVLIRDSELDDGSVPSSGSMYLSPDVWNRTTDDRGTAHQDPVFGQRNYLYVRLWNRSDASVAVASSVDVWIAQAATGLSWPLDFEFLGRITAANLAPGGNDTFGALEWDPPDPNPSSHFCLYVRVINENDPLTVAETSDLGNNTRNSNNIAWRNMNVVSVGPTTSFVSFLVRNVSADRARIDLDIRIPDELLDIVQANLYLSETLQRRWGTSSGVGADFVFSADTGLLARPIPLDSTEFELSGIPFEARQAEPVRISFSARAEWDDVLPVDVIQSVDGEEVGGIRYLVRFSR